MSIKPEIVGSSSVRESIPVDLGRKPASIRWLTEVKYCTRDWPSLKVVMAIDRVYNDDGSREYTVSLKWSPVLYYGPPISHSLRDHLYHTDLYRIHGVWWYANAVHLKKYSTRPMNKVWAFRRTPYSLDMCCIFTYRKENEQRLYILTRLLSHITVTRKLTA